ncbi:MAG: glycosyltransferase family 2 protein [Thermoproteota archaeon]
MPKVSIILPARNEKENIGHAILQVRNVMEAFQDYEIVVVDDGSIDGTSSEAIRASRSYLDLADRVKVISYKPNRGKGFALKKGFEASRGENIVFIDSDLDISPNHIAHYLEALKDADMVAASKFHPESRVESPVMRKVLSLGYHWLVRFLLRIDVSDTQAGLKVFKRSALEKVMPLIAVKQYAFDAEVFAVASLYKLKVREMPVQINLRAAFSGRSVLRMFIDLLGIAYRKWVKRSYQMSSHIRSN